MTTLQTPPSLDALLADYLLRREAEPDLVPGVFAEALPDELRTAFLRELEALAEIDRLALAPPRDLPQRLGGYRILGHLGAGATGTVYEAEQVALGRRVAVKVLHDGLAADAVVRQRFQREARLAAALAHASIVGIHDFGEHEGRAFLVLQLAPGWSLRRLLHARRHEGDPQHAVACARLDDARALARTFAAIAAALAYAHARGVVHRDIKPANLMVAADGHPTVLDFGLARSNGPDTAAVTRTGDFLGTPLYMSPEQLAGGEVGPASDLWSLGCVLWECLTGQPASGPFLEEAPTMPTALRALLRRCLERDPARRCTAADLAAGLRAFAARGRCGGMGLVGWMGWVPAFLRGRRALLAAAVVAGVGAAVWGGMALRQPKTGERELVRTVLERLERLEHRLPAVAGGGG